MNGQLYKIVLVCVASLMVCAWAKEGCLGVVEPREQVVAHHFETAFDGLMNAWNVMDLLRKITIDPVSRGPFILGSIEHLLRMLTSIASIGACCTMGEGICVKFTQDFEDLSWRLDGLVDAFGSVCVPLKPDERVLGAVLRYARQLLDTCSARALSQNAVKTLS